MSTPPSGADGIETVLKPAIEAVAGEAKIRFTIHYREDGAARPQEFVDLIARWAGVEPAMRGLERLRIAWKGLPSGLDPGAGRSESQ